MHQKDLPESISQLALAIRESTEQRKQGLATSQQLEDVYQKLRQTLASKTDLEKVKTELLMNATQLEQLLNNQTTQIGKIAQEQSDRFDVLTAKIKDLTDLIEAGEVTPAVETAVAGVQTALDALDAAIPDAPV